MRHGSTSDFDFVAARLHGMKSRLAWGEALLELSHAGNALDVARRLEPPLEESAPDRIVFRRLDQHLTQMRRLLLQLSPRHARSVSSLLSWYDLANVKVLLRASSHEVSLERALNLLGPWWSNVSFQPGTREIPARPQDVAVLLPKGIYRDLLSRESGQRDNHSLESALDLAYFEDVARTLPIRAGSGVALCQLEADIFNVQVLIRGRLWYGLEGSGFDGQWTSHGAIPLQILKEMPSPEALDGFLKALPKPFQCGCEGLVEVEDCLWETLWSEARQAFLSPSDPFSAIVAFCYLKRLEASNMIRLCQGIQDAFDPQDIVSRLLGVSPDMEARAC